MIFIGLYIIKIIFIILIHNCYAGDEAHVNELIIKEIMEVYTDTTNITTIGFTNLNLTVPLFSFGLDFLLLKEYIDFEEIICFLNSEFNQASNTSLGQDSFHTFYTKNFFVYTIVFITANKKDKMALVAGPILTLLSSKKSTDQLIMNACLPIHKKREFIGILNRLPLHSNEHICRDGKLLLALARSRMENSYTSSQKFHGIKNIEEIRLNHLIITRSSRFDNYDCRTLYKFCIGLSNKIKHGSVNEIVDIIKENRHLFDNIKSIGDNNRSLKNMCIIICSIACHFAIEANVPYERMFHHFWKSTTHFEKLNSENEIIIHMTTTVEGFAHSVFNLSDNHYSLHINRILKYIKANFSEKITLKMLAEYTHVNPVYLSSLIKKETNTSLSDQINIIRIAEGKKLLIYSNKSIQDIAYDIGFNYQSHFSTVFKKMENLTPLEYRVKMGNKDYVNI